MTEVKDRGYTSLRAHIIGKWNQFVLLDEDDKEVYETILDEEDWIHDKGDEYEIVEDGKDGMGRPIFKEVFIEGNPEMEFEVVITGEDFGKLPVTVCKSQLKTVNYIQPETIDVVLEEEFDDFTFENTNDQLTITQKVEVPIIE